MIKPGTPSSCQTGNESDEPFAEGRLLELATRIKVWGKELGFQQLGITDTRLGSHEKLLKQWLKRGFHGSMEYMERHGTRRSRPAELVPGTTSARRQSPLPN